MRLVICTTLCVAGAITVFPEFRPQAVLVSDEAASTSVAILHLASSREVAFDAVPSVADEVLVTNAAAEARVDDVFGPILEPIELDGRLTGATPEQPQHFSKSELCHTAASVAAANNLPIPFFANLIQQESGFKPHVVSSAGAQGIAQFMPEVAASNGLANPFDPIESLTASGKFVARLVNHFGNLGLAAAAYNAGSQRVHDWIAKRRKLPAETRNYVRKITGVPAEAWARRLVRGPEVRLPPHARCPDASTLEAQAIELTKPALRTAQIASSPMRQKLVSQIVIRSSMPQPSQFAMGLPVSRVAMRTARGADRKFDLYPLTLANVTSGPKIVRQLAGTRKPALTANENVTRTDRTKVEANSKPLVLRPPLGTALKAGKQLTSQGVRVAAAH